MLLAKIVECPICLIIKRNKKYFSCTQGHALCEDCFGGLAGSKCPTCRKGFYKPPARNFTIEALIEQSKDLILSCINKNCDFSATRDAIIQHENTDCPELPMFCCNVSFVKKLNEKHFADYHQLKCSNECDFTGTENDVDAHMDACPRAKIFCPNCAETVVLSLMGQHYSMVHIPCSKKDCEFTGSPEELNKHKQSCLGTEQQQEKTTLAAKAIHREVHDFADFRKSRRLTIDDHAKIKSICAQNGSVFVGLSKGLILHLNGVTLKVEEEIMTDHHEGIDFMDSDEEILLTGSSDHKVSLWYLQPEGGIFTIASIKIGFNIECARLFPEFVLLGGVGQIHLRSRSSLSHITTIKNPGDYSVNQNAVALMPNGSLVMPGALGSGTLKVFSKADGSPSWEPRQTLQLEITDRKVISLFPFTEIDASNSGPTYMAIGFDEEVVQIIKLESSADIETLRVVSSIPIVSIAIPRQLKVDYKNRLVFASGGSICLICFKLTQDLEFQHKKGTIMGDVNMGFVRIMATNLHAIMSETVFYVDENPSCITAKSFEFVNEEIHFDVLKDDEQVNPVISLFKGKDAAKKIFENAQNCF